VQESERGEATKVYGSGNRQRRERVAPAASQAASKAGRQAALPTVTGNKDLTRIYVQSTPYSVLGPVMFES